MLRLRAKSSVRRWNSIRFTSQLSQNGPRSSTTTTPDMVNGGHEPPLILSRLSDRTQSRIRHSPDTEQKNPSAHTEATAAAHRKPRSRATSFVSARSAQQRDHAAEKWFTDVRELDIDNGDQSNNLKSLSRKKRTRFEFPKRHETRPRTDLNALFAPSTASTARSATLLRVQTKREFGGDYASYLPDGYVDPHRFPIDYARLILGRNKHIPLNAQTGALNIIEEAIRGKTTRQGM